MGFSLQSNYNFIWDWLNCESFLTNYGKESNPQNISSMDDSQYTVSSLENFGWNFWAKSSFDKNTIHDLGINNIPL